MKRLKQLTTTLESILELIHAGKLDQATDSYQQIPALISSLELDPPKESSEFFQDYYQRCYELNEMIEQHFEAERVEIGATLFRQSLEEKLRSYLENP